MRFINGEDYIEIIFTDVWIQNPQYVEICLDYHIEGVGWGVVGDCYFSLTAIQSLSEHFNRLIDGEIDEFHISEDNPMLIAKPFYWFDIKRNGDTFDVRFKIHDCLSDYIEISETIERFKLSWIQQECRRTYEKNNAIGNLNVAGIRRRKLLLLLRKREQPYVILRLMKGKDEGKLYYTYCVTIKKNQIQLMDRIRHFEELLSEFCIEGEKLEHRDRSFVISGASYEISLILEAYYKHADTIGYIDKNGMPSFGLMNRMGCYKAKRYLGPWWSDYSHALKKRRSDLMMKEELISAYPNPGDRYVAICKNLKK